MPDKSGNPYLGLEKKAFWKFAVANGAAAEAGPIYQKKFPIGLEEKIATAGSCFAQHLTERLRQNSFNLLDMEPFPPSLSPQNRKRFGFGMYSARYGNIYTAQQLLQLVEEALGLKKMNNVVWRKGSRFVDALRPSIEPDGLETEADVRTHREFHLQQVRKLFQEMDVLIFTLGLTESWAGKVDGTIYPTAPGVIAGTFSDQDYELKVFDYGEVVSAMTRAISMIESLRKKRPPIKVILTVSPVPLTATASGRHVLQANTYSKSVLRAAAGALAQGNDNIDYFPSFEIITNPAAKGAHYCDNLRTVKAEGVDAVMNEFFAQHRGNERSEVEHEADLYEDDVICDDMILESLGQ